MKITVHFDCGGCNDTVDVEADVRREFTSFSGRGHGIGTESTVWPDLQFIAPPGWLAFDPYTHVTYCPQCWRKINQKEATHD